MFSKLIEEIKYFEKCKASTLVLVENTSYLSMILQSKINCLKYFDKNHCSNCIFDVLYKKTRKTVDEPEAILSNQNTPATRFLPSEQSKHPYYTGQKIRVKIGPASLGGKQVLPKKRPDI